MGNNHENPFCFQKSTYWPSTAEWTACDHFMHATKIKWVYSKWIPNYLKLAVLIRCQFAALIYYSDIYLNAGQQKLMDSLQNACLQSKCHKSKVKGTDK